MPTGSGRQRGSRHSRPGVPQELDIPAASHDRELQDEIIRYLMDAKLRSSETKPELLNDRETERARRFSHFLARRYYRDRLHRGFRYSAGLVGPAYAPEHVVESPEFDSILETCTLGSLETSREVGQLARAHLLPIREEEWWSELLDYELGFFIQLAASETLLPGAVPKRSPSAIVRRFQFRIPELLERLKNGGNLADGLRAEVTLLFSRTHHGKIYVVEIDESALAVFSATDDQEGAEPMAASSSISLDETRRILATLSDIGAVVLPA